MQQLPVDKILEVCQRINNGRTIPTVFTALEDEVRELREEVVRHLAGQEPGPDGIVGEAIDCILCLVDLIYQKNPSISKGYILSIVTDKLTKWETLYGTAERATMAAQAKATNIAFQGSRMVFNQV